MNDLFPLNEYRGVEKKDTTVKAKIASAQAVVIDTNTVAANADTLATAILTATKNNAQTYTFEVNGIVTLADCVTAMKRINLTYGSISGLMTKITSLKIDWAKVQTTLTVRGTA